MRDKTSTVVSITCKINGDAVKLDADGEGSVIAELRARGLYSVRETCGVGVCGTCTVLLDGEPVSTCILPKFALEGKSVRTVESMTLDGTLHDLQKEFVEKQAFQCSFCTPGFLASAHALLSEASGELTRSEIVNGLSGHLCRCGCYDAIIEAVQECSRRRCLNEDGSEL